MEMCNVKTVNADFMSLAKNTKNRGIGILSNPFKVPRQIILVGTMAEESAKTYFFIDDSCNLASQTGAVSTAAEAGIAFTTVKISIGNIQKFLQTHALIIGGYNFLSSDASQLTNNLEVINTSLDGNSSFSQLFSSLSVSNMQQNQNLLNVDQPFVWTNQDALRISAAAQPADGGNTTMTFTMKIAAAVPYGKLDEFLSFEQIPQRSAQ